MAFMQFVKVFVIVFLMAAGLAIIVLRYIPRPWAKGWRAQLGLYFFGGLIAYVIGLSAVRDYADTAAESLSRHEALGVNNGGYLLWDFAPTLRNLGGSYSPAVRSQIERFAREGRPCAAAQAAKLLGEKVDVKAACEADRDDRKKPAEEAGTAKK